MYFRQNGILVNISNFIFSAWRWLNDSLSMISVRLCGLDA
ncbi:hypothetical protein HMPREF0758_1568 [Serratia odorifera DSM 4582]|uniref:Uncharacterized protein n=1 Tax=Serratia odorifera DSM 4582 TaxID=667129 RepID=D4E068_SEROD|nr:hypothetical protein HMPREF0758_1568 [Serratia odorifera DSM 4582]